VTRPWLRAAGAGRLECAPAALGRRFWAALNFTVRHHDAHPTLPRRRLLTSGCLRFAGATILSSLSQRHLHGDSRFHSDLASNLSRESVGWSFEGRVYRRRRTADFSVDLRSAGHRSDRSEVEILVTDSGYCLRPGTSDQSGTPTELGCGGSSFSAVVRSTSNNRWRGP
jgi:hypothetical protein